MHYLLYFCVIKQQTEFYKLCGCACLFQKFKYKRKSSREDVVLKEVENEILFRLILQLNADWRSYKQCILPKKTVLPFGCLYYTFKCFNGRKFSAPLFALWLMGI